MVAQARGAKACGRGQTRSERATPRGRCRADHSRGLPAGEAGWAVIGKRPSVQSLKTIVERQFPELWPPVEATLATILAMVPEDVVNPPTCILVGPPSSAKTTVLDIVGEIDDITYRSDRFTPKAFVTHAANVKKEQLDKIDLLPRVQYKTLLTPELAPIFRGDEKSLTDTFAILTAVLDGHGYIGDSGTQGRRGYTGDYLFGWLGATTPLPTRVWTVMAQLGSRLFFLDMPPATPTREGLVASHTGEISYRDRVATCHEILKEFLRQRLDEYGGVRGVRWDRAADATEVLNAIADYASLTARLRSVVSVWQERGAEDFSYTPPNIEVPYRAMAVLYNHARGRALLHGRRQLSLEDVGVVAALAVSSMPSERAQLLRAMRTHRGVVTTAEAAEALRVSQPTAGRVMRALDLLDVARLSGSQPDGYRLTLRDEWRWYLGEANTRPSGFQRSPAGVKSETGVCSEAEESDDTLEVMKL